MGDSFKIVKIDELMENFEIMGRVDPSLNVLQAGEHPIGEPSKYYLTRVNCFGLELRTKDYGWDELEHILKNKYKLNIYLLDANDNQDAHKMQGFF